MAKLHHLVVIAVIGFFVAGALGDRKPVSVPNLASRQLKLTCGR